MKINMEPTSPTLENEHHLPSTSISGFQMFIFPACRSLNYPLLGGIKQCKCIVNLQEFPAKMVHWFGIMLLREAILHQLGCIKPCKSWDIYHINWCRISPTNSITLICPGCTKHSPSSPGSTKKTRAKTRLHESSIDTA